MKLLVLLIFLLGGISVFGEDRILATRLNDISRDPVLPVPMNIVPDTRFTATDSVMCPNCRIRLFVPGYVKTATMVRAWRELEYDVRLDVSEYCTTCAKKAEKALPFVYIVVTHPDETVVRTPIRNPAELAMLDAFFKGESTFKGPNGQSVALRRYIGNLRQFLGIPAFVEKLLDTLPPPIVDSPQKKKTSDEKK